MPAADGLARIADSHHHLWDLRVNRYPWLEGVAGEAGALPRTYIVDDILADAAGLPLVASVHVEAAHDRSDQIRETRWLQAQADATGFPTAIVPAAVLEAADVADALERHLEHDAVRGIRQMLDRDPATGDSQATTLMTDDRWRHGLKRLAPLGLSFDLQVLPSQLPEAARLAADFDETVFVLNHGGYHVAASPEQYRLWRHGIGLLARQPNVVVKASGYDAVDPTWAAPGYADYVNTLLEAFGVDRVLFGSNFPVDGLTTTYGALVSATLDATSGLSVDEQDRFFFRNTVRIYRLAVPDAGQRDLRRPGAGRQYGQ
jgi:predicted TIM-barrel fold metal-dependent hydrolase